jgi:PAT family beta-lactamase induction signal transducer AmpG
MFTSPVSDWSYYENNGLEVTDDMRDNAESFQSQLKQINSDLSHPEEWVRVIDDNKGNSDHFNFIMHNHTATWLRGQHQYLLEEGDSCEQTPKHSQSDTVAVINTMAGGRNNLESGLQTGLDIVATLAWLDWNSNDSEMNDEDDSSSTMSIGSKNISGVLFSPWFLGMFVVVGFISVRRDRYQLGMILEEESEFSDTEGSESNGKTLIDNYQARVLTLCALYVAQGIPWGFITVTFVTFLAVEGVAAKELAFLLTLGTLPWSLKFLWGPVIDRFQYRRLGRRRPWILIAQTGMILILSSMLFIPNPASNVQLVATMFLIYNIFTSLQDVSTDALAVDILKPHEMEKVNSYMFTSKTVGGMIGGAGLGTIIGTVGITGAIMLQIPILLVIMLVPLLMRERPGEKLFPWDKDDKTEATAPNGIIEEFDERTFKEILMNVKTAFSLRSTQIGILLSLVISLSFFLVPILPLLFLAELGWGQEKFNATKGGVILVVTMIGYIVGGQLGRKFGGKLVMIYSALGAAITTAFWGMSEPVWDSSLFMMSIWSVHTFLWAMVSINVYSLMMRITWGEVGGTQFTAYMAMMNLSAIIGYQLTDPLASRFDYPTLFLISGVLETLVILGAVFIDPDETRAILGDNKIPG